MDNQASAELLSRGGPMAASQMVALEVIRGREPSLLLRLRRLGASSLDSPLAGYVVACVPEEQFAILAHLTGVLRVMPLAHGEAFHAAVEPGSLEPLFQSGDLVRIRSGTYATLSGILADWDGTQGSVDVVLFGRALVVRVHKEQIDAIPIPGPWK